MAATPRDVRAATLGRPVVRVAAMAVYDAGGFGTRDRTVCEAWQIVETAMAITVNHGGGHSFRLCPKPAHMSDLTEACFQRTMLEFVGDTQWVQFGLDFLMVFLDFLLISRSSMGLNVALGEGP